MSNGINGAARRGQGLVEYILLVSLVVADLFLILRVTGFSLRDAYCRALAGLGSSSRFCERSYCSSAFDDLNGWQSSSDLAWEIQDGQLCNRVRAEQRIFNDCSMEKPPEDYSIHLDGATLERGNGYGVYFRIQSYDPTNGYVFQYDPGLDGGSFVFRKWVNGWEVWAPLAVSPAVGYGWYNEPRDIDVVVKGDTFEAYVDGELVLTASDDTYPDGGAGLRTWDGTEVCFDGFSVDPVSY